MELSVKLGVTVWVAVDVGEAVKLPLAVTVPVGDWETV